MAMQSPITVFISYSRKDTEFVDLLQKRIEAHGFGTWVDRRKLEAGQDWPEELKRAIERCQALVLVMSPDALDSRNVKNEYRHALDTQLVVIPLLYKPVPEREIPIDIKYIERIDYQGDLEEAVLQLTKSLEHQFNSPGRAARAPGGPSHQPGGPIGAARVVASPAQVRELYDKGDEARAQGNLHQANNYFQQIVAINPNYLNGRVAKELAELQPKLRDYRLTHLPAEARVAEKAGDWDKAIEDWQALLQLTPDDSEVKGAIDRAKQNQGYADMYDIARDRVGRGQLDSARQKLVDLWDVAPYYGDPDNLAPRLKVTVPPSYEAQQAAKAAAIRAAEAAKTAVAREEAAREAVKSKRQGRKEYVSDLFGFAGAVWFCVAVYLAALGWLGAVLLTRFASPLLANTLGSLASGGSATLVEQAIVAVVVVLLAILLGAAIAYRRAMSPGLMLIVWVMASVFAVLALLATPILAAWPSHITTYHFLFLGNLRMASSTPWSFGGLFALTNVVVGVVVLTVIGIWVGITEDDFWYGVGIGALVGLLGGLGVGAVTGVAVGYWGWFAGGALTGGLITLAFSYFLFRHDGDEMMTPYLFILLGCFAGLALLNWLFCWFPFSVSSLGALEWFIGALAGMLVMAGLIVSFTFWVRRPTASASLPALPVAGKVA